MSVEELVFVVALAHIEELYGKLPLLQRCQLLTTSEGQLFFYFLECDAHILLRFKISF